ncbi:ribosome 60S biogenesis N-terminal-domain-containing protein [Pseudomassariella vexata]|uniref:Ribosome 60S biogenesis N-terminal-domain-containing protein n=1 Tax=Pseudomassariella vexata TaxID=1141098 RepID=A0A1Y2E1S5_9PEZI|nr:ribosome 60S biogenesis N-terminal-domain-containing protein [Pseudomassariella vexata]ORY65304.1 ribosome 60S biogenesis N-terminal-domain-containing protein [Pseudomassariella vexata]
MERKRKQGAASEQIDTSRPPKRKRNIVHEAPTSEEIHTARQLHQLLTFEQDLRQSRHGLQSFKDLLDGVLNETGDGANRKLNIVAEYLEITKPRQARDETEDVPVYLPDIMETWSMAAQMGNENVMSAVAVVLALLIKVISNHVDMVPIGMGICRTILQRRQLELLAKNLSADKGKDFIVSPTLRLVREIVSLDGGALAMHVFRARNFTFKSLARNMSLRFLGDGLEDPKRPSVRTNAVRVLMSALKLSSVEAKRDILSQKDVVAALMRALKEDPPYLVFEILDTLRSSVVLDQKLRSDVKIKILNSQSLARIASLYSYQHAKSSEDGTPSVEDAAHNFLMAACTEPSAGILRSQQGYYPEGVDSDKIPNLDVDKLGDLGLESISWMEKFNVDVPVRNSLLSEFILTLRPWSSTKQNELLVAIFEACPELIANYFANKKAFSFDPKLSATWIGYATLLFNTIRLDVPPFFGHYRKYARIPPPTAVVLGNIIPLPLELKSISRCLNQKSKLISYFAIRLLVIALEKLSAVLDMYREASSLSDKLWMEAAHRLVDDFCQRIPTLKDIITAYRAISDEDILQRAAASRLLLLYHEIIPQAALAAKFDFSPLLSAALKRLEAPDESVEDATLRLMELENMFAMAKHSPSMRWFAPRKDAPHSPFITVMKLYIDKTQDLSASNLTKILNFIAEEHDIVERGSAVAGINPIIVTLQSLETVDPSIWTFLDNCAERCARSPMKYQEMISELALELESSSSVQSRVSLNPVVMTMAEQLPFAVSSSTKVRLISLAGFLSELLGNSGAMGTGQPLLAAVLQRFMTGFGDSKARKHLSIPEKMEFSQEEKEPGLEKSLAVFDAETGPISQEQLEEMLSVPVKANKDNSALMKWSSKAAEDLIEEGYAASVIWLLASEHPSIRKEALTAIVKIAAKIKESTYEESEQVWLLLSELAETSRKTINEARMPSTILSFVCRCLDVLKNPTHCLYPKINTFLTRVPVWDLEKLPLVQDILQEGPKEDNAYYSEVSWLLSYLLDGLRTPTDVAVLHRRKVFERILTLYCNPYMGPNLRTQILRIVYRLTTVEGGSDTLITRFGGLSWNKIQEGMGGGQSSVYQGLMKRLWQTCDQERITSWSSSFAKNLAAFD